MQGEYEKVKNALAEVRQKGYGIVLPDKTEISLDEPGTDPPRQQIRGEDPRSGTRP